MLLQISVTFPTENGPSWTLSTVMFSVSNGGYYIKMVMRLTSYCLMLSLSLLFTGARHHMTIFPPNHLQLSFSSNELSIYTSSVKCMVYYLVLIYFCSSNQMQNLLIPQTILSVVFPIYMQSVCFTYHIKATVSCSAVFPFASDSC